MSITPRQLPKGLDTPVEELELSVRTYNCLKNVRIETVQDILKHDVKTLLQTKNFGRKSLEELESVLRFHGILVRGRSSREQRLLKRIDALTAQVTKYRTLYESDHVKLVYIRKCLLHKT